MLKILTVVGARPQFVKAAVISRYLRTSGKSAAIREVLVHTGQHYDALMSDVFFQELEIPAPDYSLEVGSGASAAQMARMLERLGPVLEKEAPRAVLIYGDTHSTLAAAIASAHLNIPVVHVEAGERIYRRLDVPEEINRVLTDHSASLCLTCTGRATRYLLREGMSPERVRFVGDPMYELFLWASDRVGEKARVSPASYGVTPGGYHLATIHRAQNTRDPRSVAELFDTLDRATLPVLLPTHPRVRNLLRNIDWQPKGNLRLLEPLGYFDFLALLRDCRSIVTDSGGVSRESFYARRPCVVPMENCWWPELVESGWIRETGSDRDLLLEAVNTHEAPAQSPEALFGDGQASGKIIAAIEEFTASGSHPRWHRLGSFADLPAAAPTGFTLAAYDALLKRFLDAGYAFLGFPEAGDALAAGKPFLLLRHDIDFDVEAALRMATIEAAAGVRSTYFFILRTDHYNLLSAATAEAVARILDQGHRLGLHFDCAAYPGADTAALAEACRREAGILQDWFRRPVETVSYHRPSAGVLTGDPALSAPLPHTYQQLFTGPIAYISDSRGRWPGSGPTETEAFASRRPMHMLVHPIWWNGRATGPFETLERWLDSQRTRLEQSAARNCSVFQVGRLKEDPWPNG